MELDTKPVADGRTSNFSSPHKPLKPIKIMSQEIDHTRTHIGRRGNEYEYYSYHTEHPVYV